MKAENLIDKKSFDFAVRVVRLYKHLCENKKEYVLSKQILRSGTSIGANVSEGLQGASKRDFVAKLSIALKEAQETSYWIRLLKETDYLSETELNSLHPDLVEIIKMLTSILKTSRASLGAG